MPIAIKHHRIRHHQLRRHEHKPAHRGADWMLPLFVASSVVALKMCTVTVNSLEKSMILTTKSMQAGGALSSLPRGSARKSERERESFEDDMAFGRSSSCLGRSGLCYFNLVADCTVSCDTGNNYGPSGTATDTCASEGVMSSDMYLLCRLLPRLALRALQRVHAISSLHP
eukprot:622214-Amphidinium_carterae.1